MKPKILSNPYWKYRISGVLTENHPIKYNGVGIRVFGSEENAVLVYPLANREFSRLEDYLKLEWFDTHDEGRTFVPCERTCIESFLKEIARGG